MRKAIREQLIKYAEQFETASFIQGDPSWFMHQVKGRLNQETMAFIAGSLSYGSRKQFLPKIQTLLDASQGEPYEWVRSGAYATTFPDNHQCFYRLYDNHTMLYFMRSLQKLIATYWSLGEFSFQAVQNGNAMDGDALKVLTALSHYFKEQGLTGIVPQPVTSLCKRPCMFLRWMVRDNSPVDLGLWSNHIDKTSLYIPMDTHVMQTARRLGLVSTRTASWATIRTLTREMAKVFPTDPARGDFALYGADALKENPTFST
ncbi:MAG: TIGR02757 family protein [Prevotella sp.]|jgi:uncharacterized protein (TIGR02757 family)